MSIIPKLVTLGLAAARSSPIHHHHIDFSMPGSDSQRINQLWLVTYPNDSRAGGSNARPGAMSKSCGCWVSSHLITRQSQT
jgi:hypothetical protein